jgi:glycosyltransferase involved in cell wall biosynthesis
MASGTPVVTSNTSSLPEVVGDAAVLQRLVSFAKKRIKTSPFLRKTLEPILGPLPHGEPRGRHEPL